MSILRNILGPKSKYDKTIPYTYEARVNVLNGQGDEPVYEHYFSDTVCGLVEHLQKLNIDPNDAQLVAIHQDTEDPIKIDYCLDPNGKWLVRPEICDSMEKHFKGHIDEHCCSFRDRSREAY